MASLRLPGTSVALPFPVSEYMAKMLVEDGVNAEKKQMAKGCDLHLPGAREHSRHLVHC